jgi:excisionase family DNA binding protein
VAHCRQLFLFQEIPVSTATMPPDAATAENWTLQDVSRYLRCSERTVYLYVKNGKLPQPRRLGQKWLFSADRIKALLNEQPAGA